MSSNRSSIPRAVSPIPPGTSRGGSSRLSTGSTYGGGSAGPSDTERRLPSPQPRESANYENDLVNKKRRTAYRPRTTGGFLLPDVRTDGDLRRGGGTKDVIDQHRSRTNGDIRRGKSPIYAGRSTPSPGPDFGLGLEGADANMDASTMQDFTPRSSSREARAIDTARRRVSRIPSPVPRPMSGTLDVDSTQIVNMALNLSESRRIAARRNISAPVPPRLAPVPDRSNVGSLKQHFHQQRRTSHNASPGPDTGVMSSPRHPSVSSPGLSGATQHPFEHEGSYNYQFSSSTLNRAQKAKEHLELMAQYRRLLQFVPPISAQMETGQNMLSPPISPGLGKSPGSFPGQRPPLGRPYNPLQYIRNRKVRARERKAIDGEAQGFSDVSRVTDWIDQTAVNTPLSGSSKLPHFPGAHEHSNNPSSIPRPSSSTGKPKRPRLDWSFEPADMLADAYWFEQDDNRSLIEDRNYAKIFPSKATISPRPWSPQGLDQHKASLTSQPLDGGANDTRTSLDLDLGINRIGTDGSKNSARSRARQKLHDIKGSHKHSDSQHGYHDFLRLGKSTTSDTSDSETDRRKRERSGTLTASGRDLLEKQMRDILAQEAADKAAEKQNTAALQSVPETTAFPHNIGDVTLPKQNGATPRSGHMRGESSPGVYNAQPAAERWPPLHLPAILPGRASLDIPSNSKRSSVDHTFSGPIGPDVLPSRRGSTLLASGSEMSPSNSRPVSPTRKPLAKVISIFRDRSRDRGEEKDAKGRNSIDNRPDDGTFTPMDTEPLRFDERASSPSPVIGKLPSRTTNESHKSHRSLGSMKLRADDVNPFRTIIKSGSKLDSMVRGGVSKMTDMIWRKDSDDSSSSSSSSEDSDGEGKRGRRSKKNILSRDNSRHREKHFLDVMPQFKSALESGDERATPERQTVPDGEISGFLSPTSSVKGRKSTRFDKLKPPRLSVPNSPTHPRISEEAVVVDGALPGKSDTEAGVEVHSELIGSHQGSRKLSQDLHSVLAGAPHALDNIKKRQQSMSFASKRDSGRHWPITDRDVTPRQTQLSRSELASVRALILSSGIKAMEISRRANEAHPLFAFDTKGPGISWSDVSPFVPNETATMSATQLELYPTTARILISSVDKSMHNFHEAADHLSANVVPSLQQRIDTLHLRIATDLIKTTQETVDDADEVCRDLVHNQRMKVQHVVEAMDKMSRKRRRRFRWFRRGVWLVVEWVLVASMWWLWTAFVVFRFLGLIVLGIWGGVRWLLWL